MPLAMQVAARTAAKSIPAALRTVGCTKMMYAIVRKVVMPAMTSVRTVVRFSESRKRRSITQK